MVEDQERFVWSSRAQVQCFRPDLGTCCCVLQHRDSQIVVHTARVALAKEGFAFQITSREIDGQRNSCESLLDLRWQLLGQLVLVCRISRLLLQSLPLGLLCCLQLLLLQTPALLSLGLLPGLRLFNHPNTQLPGILGELAGRQIHKDGPTRRWLDHRGPALWQLDVQGLVLARMFEGDLPCSRVHVDRAPTLRVNHALPPTWQLLLVLLHLSLLIIQMNTGGQVPSGLVCHFVVIVDLATFCVAELLPIACWPPLCSLRLRLRRVGQGRRLRRCEDRWLLLIGWQVPTRLPRRLVLINDLARSRVVEGLPSEWRLR
mmetsp:Transcript_42827/g.114603  ORF Transcript_42827/g.114603 Transcript_42827/m.114603 type:complete len:317 (-) Transcript_42827:64-1014(-)